MSEIAKLSAAPRVDILPGYAVPKAVLADFGMVEDEIERRHLRAAGAGAVGLPANIATMMVEKAMDDIAHGRFKYGGMEFQRHIFSISLSPFLVYVLLRHTAKEMTLDKAAGLVTDENQAKVNTGCLEQFGYPIAPPKKGDDSKNGPSGGGQTGAPSTTNSASVESATPTPET